MFVASFFFRRGRFLFASGLYQSEYQAQINQSFYFSPLLLMSFGALRKRKQQYGSLITETCFTMIIRGVI